MAYASGNLSTYETTGFTNDKAMFVAPAIKGSMVTASSWNAVGGDPASNDNTTSTTPASRAYDGLAAAQTTYNGNITVDSYFNIEFVGTTLATFDVFGFINHNFKSDGVTDLYVDVADNQAFTQNVKNIYSVDVSAFSGDIRNFAFNLNHATQTDTVKSCNTHSNTDVDVPSLTNLRVGDLVSGTGIPANTYIAAFPDSTSVTLTQAATATNTGIALTFSQFNYSSSGTAQQFSSVRYLRVRLTSGGATYSPKIGEFFFGQRHQLKRNPDVPFDDKSYLSSVSDHLATSGVRRRYVMNKGQATRNISITTGDSDEISAIEDFWIGSEYGTESFLWIESPSSSPQGYLMNTEEPILNFPLLGPTERNATMVLLEQPPFKSSES
jgi:hypothetical protein